MTNAELADEIIRRLNVLAQDPALREDIQRLLETRIPCSEAAARHPTIQTTGGLLLGFLGLLNGLVGTDPDGQAYIAGSYSADAREELVYFQRYHV